MFYLENVTYMNESYFFTRKENIITIERVDSVCGNSTFLEDFIDTELENVNESDEIDIEDLMEP